MTTQPPASNVKLCEAQISISLDCPNPALPGKRFCSFHDSLVGPWAKAAVSLKKFRTVLLKRPQS
jgi:hypothetical protein